MRKKYLHVKHLWKFLLPLMLVFLTNPHIRAQSAPAQDNQSIQKNEALRREVTQFDRFMDSHREISEQVTRDPSLLDNRQFLQTHTELQLFLKDHPQIQQAVTQSPSAFMSQEHRFEQTEDRRDNDTLRREVTQFDRFMDGHREIGEQVRKNPSLLDNRKFLETHPALQEFLRDHPDVNQTVRQSPSAFMSEVKRYDQTEGRRDTDRRDNDVARRDNDNNRRDNDVARRDDDNSRRDDDAARRDNDNNHRDDDVTRRDNDNSRRDNDAARRDDDNSRRDNDVARRDNDNGRRDNDTARRDDDSRRDNDVARRDNDAKRGDNDTTRRELAQFDSFADKHREIAEQIRKNPSLVNNEEFLENHPALQAYMQEHPGMRQEIQENPNNFMHQENRFDHHEDFRDSDSARGRLASFGEFLGGHSSVAQQVSKDPSLVKNDDYLKHHPELQEYLNSHPGVKQEMNQNPQTFIKSAQQFKINSAGGTTSGGVKTPAPTTTDAKPKL